MLAKPPLWLACPPLEAISRTSSLGLGETVSDVDQRWETDGTHRLAKLPGLVFWVPDMVVIGWCDSMVCYSGFMRVRVFV
jgi:hypothetical protein